MLMSRALSSCWRHHQQREVPPSLGVLVVDARCSWSVDRLPSCGPSPSRAHSLRTHRSSNHARVDPDHHQPPNPPERLERLGGTRRRAITYPVMACCAARGVRGGSVSRAVASAAAPQRTPSASKPRTAAAASCGWSGDRRAATAAIATCRSALVAAHPPACVAHAAAASAVASAAQAPLVSPRSETTQGARPRTCGEQQKHTKKRI